MGADPSPTSSPPGVDAVCYGRGPPPCRARPGSAPRARTYGWGVSLFDSPGVLGESLSMKPYRRQRPQRLVGRVRRRRRPRLQPQRRALLRQQAAQHDSAPGTSAPGDGDPAGQPADLRPVGGSRATHGRTSPTPATTPYVWSWCPRRSRTTTAAGATSRSAQVAAHGSSVTFGAKADSRPVDRQATSIPSVDPQLAGRGRRGVSKRPHHVVLGRPADRDREGQGDAVSDVPMTLRFSLVGVPGGRARPDRRPLSDSAARLRHRPRQAGRRRPVPQLDRRAP